MNLLETTDIFCPYCGEKNQLLVDCSLPFQDYIEDCQVCCRPMSIRVTLSETGLPKVTALSENDR
ncbi:MAG TPA: CPXCG motif-containing cysteine-rich protein [Geothermobacteraceae bacterium]|nr:CPXCG motif-containing cysteine-rich protein [Geothermobacteraceae bacterium]